MSQIQASALAALHPAVPGNGMFPVHGSSKYMPTMHTSLSVLPRRFYQPWHSVLRVTPKITGAQKKAAKHTAAARDISVAEAEAELGLTDYLPVAIDPRRLFRASKTENDSWTHVYHMDTIDRCSPSQPELAAFRTAIEVSQYKHRGTFTLFDDCVLPSGFIVFGLLAGCVCPVAHLIETAGCVLLVCQQHVCSCGSWVCSLSACASHV